jgi:poly-gamma-glutamate capsule biosynthesis protein CapA/YwtB (metallophosphatase superfamily)
MRNNLCQDYFFIMTLLLTGCTVPVVNMTSNPERVEASSTQTIFLTETHTPNENSETSPSASSVATSMPTLMTTTPSFHVNLAAVGDIMLARTIGEQVESQGPEIVFSGVQSVFKTADVLVGNLECTLTEGGDQQPKGYPFAASPETTQALALAGFDVLSLANNHSMDYGREGLIDTINNLAQYGITSVGAGEDLAKALTPAMLERNGLRMAFLAYVDVPMEENGFDTRTWIATASTPGIAWADLDQIRSDVIAARQQADIVIVLLHSGYEVGTYIPSISPNQQAEAYAAIDAGATLVIGSHPHILQTIERYRNGLIAYSLGNFAFDGYQGIANASIILRVVLTPEGVESYDYVPVLIENGLPVVTTLELAPFIATRVAP